MTCGFLGVQTLGTETVRLLRSRMAALNDNLSSGRMSLREEALPCCAPVVTGEHIVARDVPLSTSTMTEYERLRKVYSVIFRTVSHSRNMEIEKCALKMFKYILYSFWSSLET